MFKPINDELMDLENNAKKLQEDHKKREDNAKLVAETREATGAEKDKLLQEQKEKDLLLKQQFHELTR